jgi:hypothetical protein
MATTRRQWSFAPRRSSPLAGPTIKPQRSDQSYRAMFQQHAVHSRKAPSQRRFIAEQIVFESK